MAHVGHDPILRLLQRSGLPNVMSEWLLGKDMLPSLHGIHGRHEVGMIWRVHHHSIDVMAHFVRITLKSLYVGSPALSSEILYYPHHKGLQCNRPQKPDKPGPQCRLHQSMQCWAYYSPICLVFRWRIEEAGRHLQLPQMSF